MSLAHVPDYICYNLSNLFIATFGENDECDCSIEIHLVQKNCISELQVNASKYMVKSWISFLSWISVVYSFNAKVYSTLTTSDRHYRAVKKSRHLGISNNIKLINEMNSITVGLSGDLCWWMVPFEYDNEINSTRRVSGLDAGST